ncbi:MAG: sugar phosphate isomerase/epimerase [Alicyclobacillus sp.]|nr:sugar phosphate isomerase/epimerase [Alicyclobacillus sp.]
MKVGINQWCFPDGTPLDQVLEMSARAGFDGVELNLYGPGAVGLTLETSATEARQIQRQASDAGLELRSLSTGLLWQTPLSDPDPEVRAKGRQVVEKQIELAAVMGADTVLVVPGLVNRTVSYEDCYARAQEMVGKLAAVAERSGVRIGIENVWNKFLLSPMDMVRFIDGIGSKWVGAYFDVGNVLQFGFPEQWISSLGNRIFKVHVKDFLQSVGNINGFVPLLAGDVSWQAVRQALVDVGYDDYLTAELAPYSYYSDQLIIDTALHIRRIIDGE